MKEKKICKGIPAWAPGKLGTQRYRQDVTFGFTGSDIFSSFKDLPDIVVPEMVSFGFCDVSRCHFDKRNATSAALN